MGDRLLPARVKYRNASVNRSKYSQADDVLYPDWSEWGIVRFVVGDVPDCIRSEAARDHQFRPAHVPLEENYAHSEIWAYRDEVRLPKADLPELVKKMFRVLMSQRGVVIRAPRV